MLKERYLLDGFQLLHAVYAVENFLKNLLQRKCNFHLVFFESHKNICIPQGTSSINRSKYLLARAIVYRHLQASLPRSHPSIELHHFDSIYEAAFTEYLRSTGVYFVMCHDGAKLESLSLPDTDGDMIEQLVERSEDEESTTKFLLRSMICFLLDEGYNVALMNGLDWQDTKVRNGYSTCCTFTEAAYAGYD